MELTIGADYRCPKGVKLRLNSGDVAAKLGVPELKYRKGEIYEFDKATAHYLLTHNYAEKADVVWFGA